MTSEFFHSETMIPFNFSDPFLSFSSSDTIDEFSQAISPDANDPTNDFTSQSESLSFYQLNSQLQPVSINGTKSSQFGETFLHNFAGSGHNPLLDHSYGGESLPDMHFLSRSHSNRCFEETLPGHSMMPSSLFSCTFSDSTDFRRQVMGCSSSPESFGSPLAGDMRRVCSTGDLQVTRYSEEERKERILKYRAKRSRRNFNKTIKYACRKTLADSRPRIRGRFARNDEPCDTPRTASSTTTDDDDDSLCIGMHGDDYGLVALAGEPGLFANNLCQPRFQFYSY